MEITDLIIEESKLWEIEKFNNNIEQIKNYLKLHKENITETTYGYFIELGYLQHLKVITINDSLIGYEVIITGTHYSYIYINELIYETWENEYTRKDSECKLIW